MHFFFFLKKCGNSEMPLRGKGNKMRCSRSMTILSHPSDNPAILIFKYFCNHCWLISSVGVLTSGFFYNIFNFPAIHEYLCESSEFNIARTPLRNYKTENKNPRTHTIGINDEIINLFIVQFALLSRLTALILPNANFIIQHGRLLYPSFEGVNLKSMRSWGLTIAIVSVGNLLT